VTRTVTRLHGRTILVTGAARGITLAISERLLADGARVVMLDRDAPAVEAAAKGLGADARARASPTSRARRTWTAPCRRRTTGTAGSTSSVNNAGITGRSFPTWEPQQRAHHQHRFDRRQGRQPHARAVLHGQGRCHRAHQSARQGSRHAGNSRQRGRAGGDRYRAAPADGALDRRHARREDSDGTRGPARSTTSRAGEPRTKRRTADRRGGPKARAAPAWRR
jgi:hypothetical protein